MQVDLLNITWKRILNGMKDKIRWSFGGVITEAEEDRGFLNMMRGINNVAHTVFTNPPATPGIAEARERLTYLEHVYNDNVANHRIADDGMLVRARATLEYLEAQRRHNPIRNEFLYEPDADATRHRIRAADIDNIDRLEIAVRDLRMEYHNAELESVRGYRRGDVLSNRSLNSIRSRLRDMERSLELARRGDANEPNRGQPTHYVPSYFGSTATTATNTAYTTYTTATTYNPWTTT